LLAIFDYGTLIMTDKYPFVMTWPEAFAIAQNPVYSPAVLGAVSVTETLPVAPGEMAAPNGVLVGPPI
jgi:hypothetical protein